MQSLRSSQIESFVKVFPQARVDEPIAPKTYLKIGGKARLFYVASSAAELLMAVKAARNYEIPWYVFGGGSNILVSDDGFEGVLIQAATRQLRIESSTVFAEAGVFTGLAARESVKAGLVGFEWGVGVPGTIGGAVYGNAGCFGGEMKDVVVSVRAYHIATDREVEYSNQACGFLYRESMFKHEPHIILEAKIGLTFGAQAEAQHKLEDVMSKRKETQPQGAFTAGCLFKNVEYENDSSIEKLTKEYEVPSEMRLKKRIPAGWLIDQLGLKGFTIGRAQVSAVHGNFLVNLGGATAQDVIQLSSLIKMKARDELGILLEDEVQLVGF